MAVSRRKGSGLSGYRVLDLTDDKGYLCGKILGDLGADVIKVEPPGGEPGRWTPPFYRDKADPERSLVWWAYNTSKRSVTLDITAEKGRETFLSLVKKSDFVIESFMPGYVKGIGLDYETLENTNPGIILVSISGFGQEGPYARFKAPDIVLQAMSGYMNLVGEPDRPPLRISIPQAYLHAGNDAATGALIALWHREQTGQGQWVDISTQECLTWETFSNHQYWDFRKVIPWRGEAGVALTPGTARESIFMQCNDGYLLYNLVVGKQARHTRAVLTWMDEEGMHDDVLSAYNWEMELLTGQLTQEDQDRTVNEIREMKQRLVPFFLSKNRRELFEQAIARGFMLAPVCTAPDLLKEPHFKARKFWQTISYPEVGKRLIHPGAPFKMESRAYHIWRRAPSIGEHNGEILDGKLRSLRTRKSIPPAKDANINEVFKGLKVLDLT